MEPDEPLHDQLSFAVVGSLLRTGRESVDTFLGDLADRLAPALGDRLTLKQERHGLHRVPVSLEVDMGDRRYCLNRRHETLDASVARVVRDVTVRVEDVPVDDWLDQLSADLVTLADRSMEIRIALERAFK